MRRSLLLSLLVHAALLGLFLFAIRHYPSSNRPISQTMVWIVDSGNSRSGGPNGQSSRTNSPHSSVGKGHPAKKGERGHQHSHKPTLNLGLAPWNSKEAEGPQSNHGATSLGSPLGTDSAEGGYGRQGDGYEVANGMGLEQEGKLYPFFESIWRKIDAVITYPKDFVEQEIYGKVTVQLVVDQRGVFTGDVRSVRGEEPMLNTLVVATLVHALRDPLPQNQWMKEKQILLVFQFDFNLIGVGQLPQQVDYAHVKNVLSFRRDAHVDPTINRAIEKFYTRYFPPIIPIPGGFFIDFPHAFIYVKNLIHPPPDEDELRKQRLDMQKEELERLIQKDGQESSQ